MARKVSFSWLDPCTDISSSRRPKKRVSHDWPRSWPQRLAPRSTSPTMRATVAGSQGRDTNAGRCCAAWCLGTPRAFFRLICWICSFLKINKSELTPSVSSSKKESEVLQLPVPRTRGQGLSEEESVCQAEVRLHRPAPLGPRLVPQARCGCANWRLQQGCRSWSSLWRLWWPPYFAARGRLQLYLCSLAHFRRHAAVGPWRWAPWQQMDGVLRFRHVAWVSEPVAYHAARLVRRQTRRHRSQAHWPDVALRAVPSPQFARRKRRRDASPADSNSPASRRCEGSTPHFGVTSVALGGEICLVPFSCVAVAVRAGDVVARCLSFLFFCHHGVTCISVQAPFSRCFHQEDVWQTSWLPLHVSCGARYWPVDCSNFIPCLFLAAFFLIFLLLHCVTAFIPLSPKTITLSRTDALLLARLFLQSVLLGLRHFNSTSSAGTLWLAEVWLLRPLSDSSSTLLLNCAVKSMSTHSRWKRSGAFKPSGGPCEKITGGPILHMREHDFRSQSVFWRSVVFSFQRTPCVCICSSLLISHCMTAAFTEYVKTKWPCGRLRQGVGGRFAVQYRPPALFIVWNVACLFFCKPTMLQLVCVPWTQQKTEADFKKQRGQTAIPSHCEDIFVDQERRRQGPSQS